MTMKEKHKELHNSLDQLVACFIEQTEKSLSETTVMELIQWSYQQTIDPKCEAKIPNMNTRHDEKNEQCAARPVDNTGHMSSPCTCRPPEQKKEHKCCPHCGKCGHAPHSEGCEISTPKDTREEKQYGDEFLAEKPFEQKNIGKLRQWLNEDRITDPKKMVTNEEISKWLLSTPPTREEKKEK